MLAWSPKRGGVWYDRHKKSFGPSSFVPSIYLSDDLPHERAECGGSGPKLTGQEAQQLRANDRAIFIVGRSRLGLLAGVRFRRKPIRH